MGNQPGGAKAKRKLLPNHGWLPILRGPPRPVGQYRTGSSFLPVNKLYEFFE